MNQRAIYLSDSVYRLLAKRAAQERVSVEQVAERLLSQELTFSTELENGQPVSLTSGDVEEALLAVQRLTTLFADLDISDLGLALSDPMLELSNVDLDILMI